MKGNRNRIEIMDQMWSNFSEEDKINIIYASYIVYYHGLKLDVY